jgi:hypothetical protein
MLIRILPKNLVPEMKQVGFRQEAARLGGIDLVVENLLFYLVN